MGPEVSVLLETYAGVYIEVSKVACTSLKVGLAQLLGVDLSETSVRTLGTTPRVLRDGSRTGHIRPDVVRAARAVCWKEADLELPSTPSRPRRMGPAYAMF